MKNLILLSLCLLLISTGSVDGQTRHDIETRYGPGENVYSVSEHLWLTPSYRADGQICMMRVYPKRVSSKTNYLDDKIDLDEALKFLNETMPIHTRGARKDGFGMSDLGGGVVWTRFNYANVRIVFVSSFRITGPPKPDAGQPVLLDFPVDEAALAEFRRKEALLSDDELIRKYVPGAKILEISWTGRKCD